jgi:phosphoribosyl 1,2-cyclic phosphodiesterase
VRFYLLASGSYGNATLIEFKQATILVDVGLGILELRRKLKTLGYKLDDIDAIFITHEHSDHIKAIKHVDLEKVYATKETLYPRRCNFVEPFRMLEFKGIKIFPIPISHDVQNGVGYVFDDGEESLVYLTDTGYISSKVQPFLVNATHYIFESNHDVEMLLRTDRSFYLKRRILSDSGHLSNEDCGEMLSLVIGDLTKSITLSHLSEDANTPQKAVKTVSKILIDKGFDLKKIKLQVAKRYDITKGGSFDE